MPLDTRTRFAGQGSPYQPDTHEVRDTYFPKCPQPSKALALQSQQKVVCRYEYIAEHIDSLTHEQWGQHVTILLEELQKHNSMHPNYAIALKTRKGKIVGLDYTAS